MTRFMASRDPAANLRSISRSAAAGFSRGPAARLCRIQTATCRTALRARSAASGIELCKWPSAAPIVTDIVRGPPGLSERTGPAATKRSGRRLSPGAQAISTPIVTTPDTQAVSVPSRSGQFRAIRVSSPWLTGRR
jgi:hypothetical protein